MTEPVIRPAGVGDLAAIVRVFLECWTVSYVAVLPAAVLSTMDEKSATALWAGALDRPGTVLVAEVDGTVLGLARYTVTGADGYLASLYVSPRSQGGGLGGRLLAAAEHGMAGSGARAASLWVFADNAPSITFYRSRGWELTGAQRVEDQFGAPEAGLAKVLG
jgi:ribosomal protein S18 acetylase RimI-like enzyme